MILTTRQRLSRKWTERFMTNHFQNMEQLENYMVQHLYTLYDELRGNDWDNLENDYLMGSIDTTQHYLLKSGGNYLDFETYVDKVDAMEWKEA